MAKSFDKLTKSESKKLNSVIRKEQGALNDAIKLTGLDGGTLRRAVAQMKMYNHNIETIRTKLLS